VIESKSEKETDQQSNEPSRNGHGPPIRPDLTSLEVHQGSHRGDTYVRVVHSDSRLLRRVSPGYLRATAEVSLPRGRLGRWFAGVKQLVVGRTLPSEAEKVERLSKIKALAVFSSDAISSSAYATEEILIVLVTAGAMALSYSLPVAFAIALLLAVVSFSYRQTVHAYPHGGGSYTVSRENLGTQLGLIAASALLIDYVLTVAVSIAAGTAAITSAVQELYPYRVHISLAFIAIITMINLRGVSESATIFAVPTYLFILSLTVVIIVGAFRVFTGNFLPATGFHPTSVPTEPLTFFLVLHAFAAGSVAMTGTEAISNGVPVFKSPESRNAATTLTIMSSILGFFFVGLTWLTNQLRIVPAETETVISQVARHVFGESIFYGIFQVATMLILVLAANTSFNGFPRLAYILARDGFMPHQFIFRGVRLAFSNGIIYLGVLAGILIIIFEGSTHALIPLYAVGVFISFTLSQAGMVRHWWRTREPGWRKSIVINALGAILTGIVLIVVGSVKFMLGAWMVFLLIPILVLNFNVISRHYRLVAEQLRVSDGEKDEFKPPRQIVIVPFSEINRSSMRALAFARSISDKPLALHITFDTNEAEELKGKWQDWGEGADLVLLESPYRSFTEPLLAYIDAIHRHDPDAYVTIVIPEYLPAHWWQHILHNQTALRLKGSLLFRRNTVVIDVPFLLRK